MQSHRPGQLILHPRLRALPLPQAAPLALPLSVLLEAKRVVFENVVGCMFMTYCWYFIRSSGDAGRRTATNCRDDWFLGLHWFFLVIIIASVFGCCNYCCQPV